MSGEVKRIRIIVKGTFGAGFKPFVRKNATILGLKGFCDLTPDGKAMEIVAEGSERALNKLLEVVRTEKPEGCIITEITHEFSEATGEYTKFELARR